MHTTKTGRALSPHAAKFFSAIASFIAERREAKLKGKEEELDTASKYEYSAWLADAARRAPQIAMVTHTLKATHPDARGSSLHVVPSTLPAHAQIGTHTLGDQFAEDVVGNAAALDVFKFLKLEVEGRSLLDWMRAGDPALREALDPDATVAENWIKAFCGLIRAGEAPASHALAKQVYWLAGEDSCADNQYHLLQPLFSSALAHAVHTEVNDARFGEDNKAAGQARRGKEPHGEPYREYQGLVVRKLGGTKPQNISQLNSERGGVNYLFDSLPPHWQPKHEIKVLNVESIFDRFIQFEGNWKLVKSLAAFLRSNPDPTLATRDLRDAISQAIALQLVTFHGSVRVQRSPGWSAHADCKLPSCEQLWLDAERVELADEPDATEEDKAFKAAYLWGDWPDEVAARFGNWLNQRLRDLGMAGLGDAEFRHWARQAIVETAWPVPMQRRAGEQA